MKNFPLNKLNIIYILMTTFYLAPSQQKEGFCGTLLHYLAIQMRSKKEQIVKIPLSKFSKLKCSFGAWRFSTSMPPIYVVFMFSIFFMLFSIDLLKSGLQRNNGHPYDVR